MAMNEWQEISDDNETPPRKESPRERRMVDDAAWDRHREGRPLAQAAETAEHDLADPRRGMDQARAEVATQRQIDDAAWDSGVEKAEAGLRGCPDDNQALTRSPGLSEDAPSEPATERRSDLQDLPLIDVHIQPGEGTVHANGVYQVELLDGTIAYLKPQAEERSDLRREVPAGTEWQREVAAYEFDREAGFGLVPETVVRHEKELGFENASLQSGVPEGPRAYNDYSDRDRDAMAALDYILANTDRHYRNYMTAVDGRPAAIDNGLSLPEGSTDPIRSQWVADRFDIPLSEDVISQLRQVDDSALRRTWLDLGISDLAVDGAMRRLGEVRRHGRITGEAWSGNIIDGTKDGNTIY